MCNVADVAHDSNCMTGSLFRILFFCVKRQTQNLQSIFGVRILSTMMPQPRFFITTLITFASRRALVVPRSTTRMSSTLTSLPPFGDPDFGLTKTLPGRNLSQAVQAVEKRTQESRIWCPHNYRYEGNHAYEDWCRS